MKPKTVEYKCLGCHNHHQTNSRTFKNRKHFKEQHYCNKCIIKMTKSAKVFEAIPTRFHFQIFENNIDYNLALEYLKNIRTKTVVSCKCGTCDKNFSLSWNKFHDRRHQKLAAICGICLRTMVQNEADAILENSKRSASLWDNDEYRIKCLRNFQEHNRKMQQDPEYATKRRRRSKSVRGELLIGNVFVAFDSGFELIFLASLGPELKIRRCRFAIPYGTHFYHPDFMVVYPDGKRVLIEIKGYYRSKVEQKQQAASNYIKEYDVADEYRLYDTNKLLDTGILTGVGGCRMWKQIKEINNARTVEFAEEKHRTLAKIGGHRSRKKNKDHKDL